MLRSVMTVTGAGIAGVIVMKLLWVLLLPVFGVLIGLVAAVLKLAFIAALIWFGYWLFRRLTERPAEG